MKSCTFDYEIRKLTLEGKSIVYRAYTGISYVDRPVSANEQIMNLYVPEAYYQGQEINGFSLQTAPIYIKIMVGGYMPSEPGVPGYNWGSQTEGNAIFHALCNGYIAAAPGTRGRTSQDRDGTFIGKAPAAVVDLKAAIRYLRHHRNWIPGDTDRIIVSGTSAGGALAALLGSSGNTDMFDEYLHEMGAAKERDDIFACCCYCPITNLSHADMAYEWQFGRQDRYQKGAVSFPLNPFEKRLSEKLCRAFPSYANSLPFTGSCQKIFVDEAGGGSLVDLCETALLAAAKRAVDSGEDIQSVPWLHMADGAITDVKWQEYAKYVLRCKPVPAFDRFDLMTPENDFFGSAHIATRHFTQFAAEEACFNREQTDAQIVKQMDAMESLGKADVKTARYWRIRHGVQDTDTSLAIPILLTAALENTGTQVNMELVWGKGHGGDYDLKEQFVWINSLLKN